MSTTRFRFVVLFLLMALSLPARLLGQDATGHWKGSIKLPTAELAFDVDLTRTGLVWSGDISIPQQNLRDVVLANVKVEGADVAFAIPNIPGDPTFAGKLNAETQTISGSFAQGGQTFAFNLAREDTQELLAVALKGFDAQVEQAMKDLLVPGMAVGIVKDGKVMWTKGFGYRDVARKEPVTAQTIFAIGSATKAFTTFTMGSLVDQGKLEWDVPAIRYLPSLRLYDEYATLHLTPRDMVTHRSGLPRHDLIWYNNFALDPAGIFAKLDDLKPNKELRQTFQYNNLMFATAGYLVSQLTGKSWEANVRERVFEPLGMRSSNFSVVESQKAAGEYALPYGEAADTLRKVNFRDITNVGPAGSINSNVDDMTKWVTIQLSDGTFNGKRLLNKSTLDDMHSPQMVIPGLPMEPMISPASYGMGWFIDTYRGHYRVHHGGNIDGFSALVTLFPHDHTGFVILTNKNGSPMPELTARHLADRLFDLKPRDWYREAAVSRKLTLQQAKESEQRSVAARVSGTKPAHALADYAGEYEHPSYGIMTVVLQSARDGGRLVVTYNNIETPFEHWHYEVFNGLENPADPAFRNTKIMFNTDRDGQVASVQASFESSVDPIVFDRRPDAQLSDVAYIQKFVGKYQLGPRTAVVALDGSRLTASLPGQPTYTLLPKRNNTFELKGLNGFRLQFTIDATGKVTETVFKQPGGIFPAKRID